MQQSLARRRQLQQEWETARAHCLPNALAPQDRAASPKSQI
ncbi:hypothetical protein [Nostoc sp.]